VTFESLAYRHNVPIADLPERWLPLIHLYDPDLPLFPIYYFHVLAEDRAANTRPSATDRAFGYVEKIISGGSETTAIIVCNKDLALQRNALFVKPVEMAVRERFGLKSPVELNDIQKVFSSPFIRANRVLEEVWYRVVANAYGNKLPFGRLYDEVFGLTRLTATFFSESGRKGELIQTHYFNSRFGVPIQAAGDIPLLDFYLLPAIEELLDTANPLSGFPNYRGLVDVAGRFHEQFCSIMTVGDLSLSKFDNPLRERLSGANLFRLIEAMEIPAQNRSLAIECFNAFNKGAHRTIIFLLLLNDLRSGMLNPGALSSSQCGSIYDGLAGKSSYQSPKVIQIYAQQSFGNPAAMPIDTWVRTFFKWPLMVHPRRGKKVGDIFSSAKNLGRVERMIWVTAQARKVHSSACNDALWCLKKSSETGARGANPLACNICLPAIRDACPAYNKIGQYMIRFNADRQNDSEFSIVTSAGNNTTTNQNFIRCEGISVYGKIFDDSSPADSPDGFGGYPSSEHGGDPITVEDFVRFY